MRVSSHRHEMSSCSSPITCASLEASTKLELDRASAVDSSDESAIFSCIRSDGTLRMLPVILRCFGWAADPCDFMCLKCQPSPQAVAVPSPPYCLGLPEGLLDEAPEPPWPASSSFQSSAELQQVTRVSRSSPDSQPAAVAKEELNQSEAPGLVLPVARRSQPSGLLPRLAKPRRPMQVAFFDVRKKGPEL